ncbi:phospholipase D family protein [Neoroseomonas soli]|uniref:Phospholipase D n=1 Tax=Neoroseomonas soli TaxID=1081025 RepID=A0A9X9WTE4_9PROT|nr:phospholipase D family protein [Neoroseomonas soli]MBR0670423.1 phospholipase D family protein [Neoroseomonas soli]
MTWNTPNDEIPANGVAVLPDGLSAFAARVAAARGARTRLDLQYYIWRGDLTGGMLAREALRVAERGVRVRMLLDDMYAVGADRVLTALDTHPHIEVRLFNATRWRRFGPPGLVLEMLFGGWHLNRRMHNKAWIADGQLAILGGRNIGDEYFDTSGTINFRDLDLAITGDAAAQAQAIFERYWHHSLAMPLRRISRVAYRRRALRRLMRHLDSAARSPEASPFFSRLAAEPAVGSLLSGDRNSHFLPVAPEDVEVMADQPEKAKGHAPAGHGLAHAILSALRSARHEALLISPYFVPGPAGAALLEDMARNGVRVSVVTNSLAATDVVAVHGGYSRYRERLLAAGIALHELKPTRWDSASVFGSRGASLHTKALVIDGERSFVGSFNLDPRSVALNTEMGAFVRNDEVAKQLLLEHARLTAPACSWRVTRQAPGRLRWTAEVDGAPQTLESEPDASLARRALARLIRWLPVESQL